MKILLCTLFGLFSHIFCASFKGAIENPPFFKNCFLPASFLDTSSPPFITAKPEELNIGWNDRVDPPSGFATVPVCERKNFYTKGIIYYLQKGTRQTDVVPIEVYYGYSLVKARVDNGESFLWVPTDYLYTTVIVPDTK